MRDSYVNNIEQILIANQTQKHKIQFLERERIKRDHYLSDLQENLQMNKETLKELNNFGPNLEAINHLIEQGRALETKLKEYYEDYQSVNATLLMEKQMRLEDKQFYSERMIQFQNKIIDLRKYLHDKQDSFSSVIIRLKKYQDFNQPMLQDKLFNFKKQMGQNHINDFITQILKEKEFYKHQYQTIKKNYLVFDELKYILINQFPDIQDIIKQYEEKHQVKINQIVAGIYHNKIAEEEKEKEKDKKKHKLEPNKQLIRLLKKEKLNNELLEQALNDAIQKNQELLSVKNILENSISQLQNKFNLLHAEHTIISLRLGQYDRHYCRKYTHSSNYYEEGDIRGLGDIINANLKKYSKALTYFYQNQPAQLKQRYKQKMKSDVQKWSAFVCDSCDIKKQLLRQNILVKSSSVPSLVITYDQNEQSMQKSQRMIIEQF